MPPLRMKCFEYSDFANRTRKRSNVRFCQRSAGSRFFSFAIARSFALKDFSASDVMLCTIKYKGLCLRVIFLHMRLVFLDQA